MQIIEKVAKTLDLNPAELEKESLKFFLEKELKNVEVEIYKLANKHGVKSVLELDKKLKRGEVKEEQILDDFMELEFFEIKKKKLLEAIEEIK